MSENITQVKVGDRISLVNPLGDHEITERIHNQAQADYATQLVASGRWEVVR